MKQLLESGVHFGHQTKRWNPKMAKYIFTERNGIYIIDLKKTLKMLQEACEFVRNTAAKGGTVLFVGTKKQAADSIKEAAQLCKMYWVNNRWLGGALTNYRTIRKSIAKLIEIEKMIELGHIEKYTKKEQTLILKEREKLEKNLEGIKFMPDLPSVLFVIDPHKETIAIKEARRMRIPIVAVVDTNCDPDDVDWIIPGNDDAIRAINLICTKIAESVNEGKMIAEGLEIPAEQPVEAKKEEGVKKQEKVVQKVEVKEESATESNEKKVESINT
jgi:small subunit ribosomal protein S2